MEVPQTQDQVRISRTLRALIRFDRHSAVGDEFVECCWRYPNIIGRLSAAEAARLDPIMFRGTKRRHDLARLVCFTSGFTAFVWRALRTSVQNLIDKFLMGLRASRLNVIILCCF